VSRDIANLRRLPCPGAQRLRALRALRLSAGALVVAVALSATMAAGAAAATPVSAQTPTQPVYGPTWAGYDAIAAAPVAGVAAYFTKVTGAWTQPAASCSGGERAQASVWIGLGGVLDTAAVYGPLQVGTDSDCEHGRAVTFAWWETYPEPLVRMRLRVAAGDELAATVSLDASGAPTLTLADQTSGSGFTKVLRGVHVRALATDSAEWIVEGPSGRGTDLTDFGSVSFTNATATQSGPSGVHTGSVDDPAWRYVEPDVLGAGATAASAHQSALQRFAAPGPLAAPGDAFTVDYGSGALGSAP
jgi:hypothetical protein